MGGFKENSKSVKRKLSMALRAFSIIVLPLFDNFVILKRNT